MGKNKGGLVFLIFLVFGFLGGLTGAVIAVPGYMADTERQPELVYNQGLSASGKIVVEELESEDLSAPVDLGLLGKGSFSGKGCIQCHSIASLNVVGGVYGPDLSNATINVPNKYGKTILEFLHEPEGIMGTVLPGKNVSSREKEGLAEYLEGAGTVNS